MDRTTCYSFEIDSDLSSSFSYSSLQNILEKNRRHLKAKLGRARIINWPKTARSFRGGVISSHQLLGNVYWEVVVAPAEMQRSPD